jgi:hypothetical protein
MFFLPAEYSAGRMCINEQAHKESAVRELEV